MTSDEALRQMITTSAAICDLLGALDTDPGVGQGACLAVVASGILQFPAEARAELLAAHHALLDKLIAFYESTEVDNGPR